MATPLKDLYSKTFFKRLIDIILMIDPSFRATQFNKDIFCEQWSGMELKQRMRHISVTLHQHIDGSFVKQLNFILDLIPEALNQGFGKDSLEFMFLPDFVEVYGIDYPDEVISAFPKITQFVSCEFAVRPFIIKYEDKMLKALKQWSQDDDHDVRRLSSEGSRPRLPWAMALPKYKKDPKPILPILEQLKNDPSEYVRRSVANNLNDIAKDHEDVVINIVKSWQGISPDTDKLIKHASRTLLKQGHPEIMGLFGFGSIKNIEIEDFTLESDVIQIGEPLTFSFTIHNKSPKDILLRMEYAIYYQKANGTLSKKVYKISEKKYEGSSISKLTRNQPFKPISTRVFHPGKHQVALVINGIEQELYDFELNLY